MSDWPVGLPQVPLRAGYSRMERNTVIRSNMGYGPAKVRNRVITEMHDNVVRFQIDDAQKATLETFYSDNKALEWGWAYPGALVNYRFLSPPAYSEVQCDIWFVTMNVEQMP